jgi:hypothetical protein
MAPVCKGERDQEMTDTLYVKNIPVPHRVGTLPCDAELAMKTSNPFTKRPQFESQAVVGINQSLYYC